MGCGGSKAATTAPVKQLTDIKNVSKETKIVGLRNIINPAGLGQCRNPKVGKPYSPKA